MICEETLVFFRACLLGAALAAVYDLFRILRMLVRWPAILVGVQDVVYFVFATVVTFSFLMAFHDGQLRVFILAGELAGGVVYFLTISVLLLKLSRVVIRLVKSPFRWLKKQVSSRRKRNSQKNITGNV